MSIPVRTGTSLHQKHPLERELWFLWFAFNACVKCLWKLWKHTMESMRLETKTWKGHLFLSPDIAPALLTQCHLLAGIAAHCPDAHLSQSIWFISYEKRKRLMWFLNNANNGQRGLLDGSQASETQAIHQTYSSSYSRYPSPFPLGSLSINLVSAGQKGWHSSQHRRTNKVKNKGKGRQENDKILSLLHRRLHLSTSNTDNTTN